MSQNAVTTSYSSTPTTSVQRKILNDNPSVVDMSTANGENDPLEFGDPYGIGTCYDGPEKAHAWQNIDQSVDGCFWERRFVLTFAASTCLT